MPELTRPKIVCLLSRYGVGARVKKNCDPGGTPITAEILSVVIWKRTVGVGT